MTHKPRSRREAGFTLIEVLAGLVLASLILVSLNMAMSAVGKGTERTRRSLGEQSEIGSAVDIFGRDVARIAKIRRPAPPGDFAGYVFDGNPDVIIYPLHEDEALDAPGLYLIRLSVTRKGDQSTLLRERAPLPVGNDNELPQWRDPVVLLSGPYDIEFAYRAQRSGLREWSNSWKADETMPEQIRLTVNNTATGRLRVPGFVQPLAIDSEVDCAGNREERCGTAGEKDTTQ
jgi:prepilin-type N-terminal cleavage/methylation domain-containing protein